MQNRTNAKEFFINLLKFSLTSTAGTTVDLGLHWVLSKFVFDGNYWGTFWVAPTISFEMSTIVNYLIAFFFIWKDRITERTPRSFFHHLLGYNAACIGAYLIKLGLMQGLHFLFVSLGWFQELSYEPVLCNFIAILISGLFTFVVNEYFVFGKKQQKEGE